MNKHLISLARGNWQRSIVFDLVRYGEIASPLSGICGRAGKYKDRYSRSFHNLLFRLEKAGYKVVRTPGVRGGEWSATYRLVAAE